MPMAVDAENFYSERAKKMRASEIRELLKLTQEKDIISFAGGLPNPLTFPVEELKEITRKVLEEHGSMALQYGTTEGYIKFREAIAARMKRWGVNCTAENVIITGGSQEALDLISKVFLDPGDYVIVGAPSYLGGLNAFRAFEANMITVPLDENGMRMDLLEEKLKEARKKGLRVKFIYTIPTFQNPAGVTLNEERRRCMIDLAEEYDVLVVEDNPYGELRYEGDDVNAVKAYDNDGRVIYLGTFSKILAPGLRMAFMIADDPLYRKIIIAKQSEDLCTATFNQYVAYEFMKNGLLDKHIQSIIKMYSVKRRIMLDSLDEYFPKDAWWSRPKGGMFCWAVLPEKVNTVKIFPKALKKKVAYIVGSAFFANGGGENTMRLNFTHPTDELIVEGVKRLSEVIKEELKG
ncbi:MAG: aminotransferase [Thermoplasmata archaeon]|nr:MAG: aminotransferase [Thermoplasmata archaeon]